ncbi:MAG: enoyl-CoA hydratase-related protein [Gordonia sp. (in: high G+C Gram-positive bacteria)]
MSTLLIDDVDGVRTATINRPDRRNALDTATYLALAAAIRDADDDPSIRVTVLTGAGGVFTSGNDIADFQRAKDSDEPRGGTVLVKMLLGARKPLIAAVEGFAVGIGTTMLLHCDLAFAGRSTVFRLPFVPLGLVPENASSVLLPLAAGSKKAAELLLLGERFTADDAESAGIVNSVVDDGAALDVALDKARALAALPTFAVQNTKALLRRPLAEPMRTAADAENDLFSQALLTDDAQAAFAKFTDKR